MKRLSRGSQVLTRIIHTEQLAGWQLDFEHLDGKLGELIGI